MDQDTQDQETVVNPMPWAALLLVIPMAAVELYLQGAEAALWGTFSARFELVRSFAFVPEAFEITFSSGRWIPEVYGRMFTYPFVHADLLNTVFACVICLALGKFVGDVLGNVTILLLAGAGAMAGAVGYAVLLNNNAPLYTGFSVAYALIGGFTYVRFAQANGDLKQRLMAFRLIVILLIINIGFVILYGANSFWVAEFSAAVMGFFVALIIGQGGFKRIMQRVRRS